MIRSKLQLLLSASIIVILFLPTFANTLVSVGPAEALQIRLPSVRSEVKPSPSGTWSATGNLLTARTRHTSTLLSDGRVLLAGGITFGPAILASERALESRAV